MPVFVNEPLAGAAGANLSALPTGATKHAGATADLVLSNANPRRLRGSGNQDARYVYPNQEPQTADWDLYGSATRLSGLGRWAVLLRCDPLAATYYEAGYTQAAGAWQIRRVVNGGSPATLASQAQSWSNGQTRNWRVRVRGTNPVILEILDAQQGPSTVITSAQDAAAGRITAAGRAGVLINAGTTSQFDNRGYHLNGYRAAALPPDPRPIAPAPPMGPLMQSWHAVTHPDPHEQKRQRWARQREIALEAWADEPWQVTVGAATYTLAVPGGLTEVDGVLDLRVSCAPQPAGFDPHQRYVAPPINSADGTVHEETDARTGSPKLVANHREDPLASFRERIAWYSLFRPGIALGGGP